MKPVLLTLLVAFALLPLGRLSGADEDEIAIPGVFGVQDTQPPSKTREKNSTRTTQAGATGVTQPRYQAETWTDEAPTRTPTPVKQPTRTPTAPTKPRKSQEIIIMPRHSSLYDNTVVEEKAPQPQHSNTTTTYAPPPAATSTESTKPDPVSSSLPEDTTPYEPPMPMASTPATGDFASGIAQVDGYTITREELYQAMLDAHGRSIFERLLNRHLLKSELEKRQIVLTESDIDAALATHIEKFRVSAGPSANLGEMLRLRYGMSLEEYKAQVVWVELALQRLVRQALQISEADLFNFYFPRRKNYATPARIRVAHILINPLEFSKNRTDKASVAGPTEWRQAMLKALDIQDKIRKNADFSSLAQQYSHDKRTAGKGGDLGFFARGTMLKPFEDAAFALAKDGDCSDLVKTMLGYHIIKRLDYTPEHIPTFDKIKEKVREDYTEYMLLAETKRLMHRIQRAALEDGRLRILDTQLQQRLYPKHKSLLQQDDEQLEDPAEPSSTP